MRLTLEGETLAALDLTPDTITIPVIDKGKHALLEMSIDGITTRGIGDHNFYSETTGVLHPSSITSDGVYHELTGLTDEEYYDYIDLFHESLPTAESIVVGIYPVDDFQQDKEDAITNCKGEYYFKTEDDEYKTVDFTFKIHIPK